MINPDPQKKNEPIKLGQKTGPTLKPGGGATPTIKPIGGATPTIKPKAPSPGLAGAGVAGPRKIEPVAPTTEPADLDLAMDEPAEEPQAAVVQEPDAGPVAPDAPPADSFDPPWVNKNAPAEEEKPREKVDFENLPQFVAQRQMLRTVRLVAIGVVTLLIVLAVLFFMRTGKGIKDAVKDSGEDTSTDK